MANTPVRIKAKPFTPHTAPPTIFIPVSHLSKEDQLVYNNTPSAWGDPAETIETIEVIAERLGVSRAEATRVFLIHHGR